MRRPPSEYELTLRQADQARADFAVIEDGLEFIMAQVARVPTRRELAWVAACSFAGGGAGDLGDPYLRPLTRQPWS